MTKRLYPISTGSTEPSFFYTLFRDDGVLMALSNAEKQKRFYDRRVKTGGVKRYEFRLSGEDNQTLKYLADHWDCSLTEAFRRSVNQAWEKEGKPVPGYTANYSPKSGPSKSRLRVRGRDGCCCGV